MKAIKFQSKILRQHSFIHITWLELKNCLACPAKGKQLLRGSSGRCRLTSSPVEVSVGNGCFWCSRWPANAEEKAGFWLRDKTTKTIVEQRLL